MRFAEFLSEPCSPGPFRGTQTSPRSPGEWGEGGEALAGSLAPLRFLPQTFLPARSAAPKPLRPPLPPAGVNVLNPHQGPGDPLFIFVSVLAEIALGGGEAADLVRINAN